MTSGKIVRVCDTSTSLISQRRYPRPSCCGLTTACRLTLHLFKSSEQLFVLAVAYRAPRPLPTRIVYCVEISLFHCWNNSRRLCSTMLQGLCCRLHGPAAASRFFARSQAAPKAAKRGTQLPQHQPYHQFAAIQILFAIMPCSAAS